MKYAAFLLTTVLTTAPLPSVVVAQEAAAETKEPKTVDPSGTWRLEYDWNGTRIKDAFRLNLAKAGKVEGALHRGETVAEIRDGMINGNDLSFSVSIEYEGTDWVTKYAGKIKGDEIEGTVVLEVNDQSWDFPWKPKRSVLMEDMVGTWQILINAQNGTVFEPTLQIAQDGEGYKSVYTSKQGAELDVKGLRVEKSHLLFTVNADLNGRTLKVDYKGRPYGDKMKGTLAYEIGDNSGDNDFTAKRKRAQQPAAALAKTRAADRSSATGLIGRRVPNFVLPDSNGQQLALADFSDAKLIVAVFLGTECPIGNAYVPDLVDLQNRYRDQGVQVIGVNANLSDSAASIAEHVKEFKIDFPILVDADQLAADLFNAQRTPEAFVLDGRRQIRYRGRIDDRLGYDFKRDKSRRADLEEAVQELLAGDDVSVAETELEGCLITRRSSLRKKGEITYAKHVAKILHERCGNCHHPGTAAPFSLLTYQDARNWSEMMQEVVVQRRMPPWNADPRFGKFSNDLRMTKEEIDTVVAWLDDGAPLGDEKDLPKLPEYAEGWTIGKPDVVFKMPQEYTIPASGTVEYQYFVTPTNFEEDVWVQAAEARPGNRPAVHHIIVFVRPKGSKSFRRLPAVAGFAPGEEPHLWPDGLGFRVPAGAELVWQVHYTPTGKVEKDRCEVGLVFCKEPPRRPVKGGGIFNFAFGIPPGASNHRVVSSKKFSNDVELLALMPHMHVRGKDFRYTAHYPDGTSEILLNVPDYDFNWQHRYRFAKPFRIPKGTTIECVAHFDNSADNPANPDPAETVRWGDQTWQEMMIGWYSHVDAPTPAGE